MCQLFETIKCENGVLFNLEFHQKRFSEARTNIFKSIEALNLHEVIEIPDFAKVGLFRCRITYHNQISKIEFIPHTFRTIKSLKVVEDNSIEYHLKFADRKNLDILFEQRGSCDDIIIVKNGCITDTSHSNLVFFDGFNWVTPDTPLLKGTQREKLLQGKKITEKRITPTDLGRYSLAGLINAMNEFDKMPVISIKNIHF